MGGRGGEGGGWYEDISILDRNKSISISYYDVHQNIDDTTFKKR